MTKAQQMKLRLQREREGQPVAAPLDTMKTQEAQPQAAQSAKPAQGSKLADKENAGEQPLAQSRIQMEKPETKPSAAKPDDENIFALANAKPSLQDFDMPPLPRGRKAAPAQPASAAQKPAAKGAAQRRPASLGNAGRSIMNSGSSRQLKDGVPKATDLAALKPKQERNYVKANLEKVVFEAPVQRVKNEEAGPAQHKAYGKVPSYMRKYNREREEAARQKEIDAEKAKMPPGTRLMPEQERRETLADLQVAIKATNDQLEQLPIAVKSMKMDAHKKELASKLDRLEKAVATFSKEKVYVQI